MYKLKLIFPCDFEVKSGEDKNKLSKLGFFQISGDNLSREVVDKGISAPFYSFLSPSVSINNPNEIECTFALRPNAHKKIVDSIFSSCRLTSDIFSKEKFAITDILYPYGIGVSAQFTDINDVNTIISRIEDEFQGLRLNDNDKNKRPEWLIYSKPIILVECDESSGLPVLESEVEIDNLSLSNQLKIENETIFCLSGALVESINTVIALLTAIKHTSSYVMFWSKGINYRKDRDEIIKNIHIYCAVFEEMRHNTILRRKNEKIIYDILYSAFDVKKIKKQINAAREYADYLINDVTTIETQKINRTVFITGYIGLTLSFFAFVPIQLRNIFWVEHPIGSFEKIVSSFALIGLVLVFCKFVLLLHENWKNTHMTILSLIKLICRRSKKSFKALPALLTILISLSLVLALIGFGVFVLSGLFKFT